MMRAMLERARTGHGDETEKAARPICAWAIVVLPRLGTDFQKRCEPRAWDLLPPLQFQAHSQIAPGNPQRQQFVYFGERNNAGNGSRRFG